MASRVPRNHRTTRQRLAIRRSFEQAQRPLSAQQVLKAARAEASGLGIATVYRTIKALLKQGWLAAIDVPGTGTIYEPAGKPHHHHFHCEQCSRVFALAYGVLVHKVPESLAVGFIASGLTSTRARALITVGIIQTSMLVGCLFVAYYGHPGIAHLKHFPFLPALVGLSSACSHSKTSSVIAASARRAARSSPGCSRAG